jgi:hypothetical protein
MFSNLFSENHTVFEKMSKNVVETEGLQMTSRVGLARLYARMCMHTSTRPGTHMHADKRKHSPTCNTAFQQQQWLRERAKILYAHCLSIC